MRVSWMKYAKDTNRFRIPQTLGLEVRELEDLETVDAQLKEMIQNGCKTIVLTDEVASFSEDIIKTYQNQKDIHIIIV